MRRLTLETAAVLGGLLAAGCSTLEPLRLPRLHCTPPTSGVLDDGYNDAAGVLHIHTTYSHDAHGLFADAVRVANDQHLQFMIFSEHNNLQSLRDGNQGWHGAVLALIGMEISTKSGHYLALNVKDELNREHMTTQAIIDAVNQQGGFGFIAHPYYARARWRDWTVTGYTGIEIYNVAHDTLEENKLQLALWTLLSPPEPFYFSILDRPHDALATWDELIRLHGHVVGIGSTDAHEFHVMGIKFAPYEDMFLMARTHVLIREPTVNADAVYDALKRGHAYASIELLADARGFTFFANDRTHVLGIMGDNVPLTQRLQLTTVLPAAGQMALYKDGSRVAATTGQFWHVAVTEPGTYRVEVYRHNKPWIFSNPIYVGPTRAATAPETPPPSSTDSATPPTPPPQP